jgi:phosphopentomutase
LAPLFPRVIVIVLDSVGIGELPDAATYGDEGSNTLGNIAAQVPLKVPTLRSLGLGQLVDLDAGSAAPYAERDPAYVRRAGGATSEVERRGPADAIRGAYGRMAEKSAGKDSVTGHWEMMGVVLDRAFPTFPRGFPAELIAEFERRIGRGTLGNVVASGTEIIDRLGAEHMRTGKPIVYTSADSVFQIAAHEAVIPIAEQYRICEIAFDMVGRGMGVGRVIARPFVGAPGSFNRTANRHDYALEPFGQTLLDCLVAAGMQVHAIGKISDLFAGRGITHAVKTASDVEGMQRLGDAMRKISEGFLFVNLVDFDTVYGHRNDVAGYAENLERFDAALAALLPSLRESDLLVITADHGNDPTTPSTDHAREYVPVLAMGERIESGVDIGTRATFADLGQTLAANFGVGPLAHGTSFLEDIVVHHP